MFFTNDQWFKYLHQTEQLEIHLQNINWEISSSSFLLEFKYKTAWGHHVGEGKSVSRLESFQ